LGVQGEAPKNYPPYLGQNKLSSENFKKIPVNLEDKETSKIHDSSNHEMEEGLLLKRGYNVVLAFVIFFTI